MYNEVYAHTLPDRLPKEWEPLTKHLRDVAELCREHAAQFNAADWGKVLGSWHDLGKFSTTFQEYLRKSSDNDAGEEASGQPGRVDHSTFGARHAAAAFPGPVGQMLPSASLVITRD